ncbi:hypothetical protein BJX99DRAFT_250819 [Aspergillus californicus]
MVYPGRPSTGCKTCRSRRIKCDEARPHCNACVRTGRECPGYRHPLDVMLRPQTVTTRKNGDSVLSTKHKDVEAHKDPKSSELSYIPCWPRQSTTAAPIVPPQIPGGLYLPMEDSVTALFFNSYVYVPRDPLVGQGSMELLPQLYAAAPFDSHLRMGALAVAYFSVAAWTRQEHLLHSAWQCFGKALSGTRKALQGDVEKTFDEILMTLLLLYIYEGFTSIADNKPASRAHLRGAIALINSCSPERRITTEFSDTLTNAVQAEIIHTAMDGDTLVRTPEVWPLSPVMPQLASSRLATISTAGVKLRERWMEVLCAGAAELDEIEAILSEARHIDDQLVAWTQTLPEYWYPVQASFIPQAVWDAGIYEGRCECYTDFWIAETWNKFRTHRIGVQRIALGCLHLLPSCSEDIEVATAIVRALASDICASVPFYLGSQVGSVRIASRVEYPIAEASHVSASHQQTAPLVGGWFIRSTLWNPGLTENLPEEQVNWIRGQDRRKKQHSKMVFSFFRSTPAPEATPESTPTQTPPQPQDTAPTSTPPSPSQATKKEDPPLPKLWTPQTNTKLLLGGAFFFTLSVLATRRALTRRLRDSIPPYYTSSTYFKPKVNGGAEAFEALHLATINVLSFGMMASGGTLYAMDINGVEDMRAYVKKGMLSGAAGAELTDADKEVEKDVEEWIGKYLGKKVEGGKLVDPKKKVEE